MSFRHLALVTLCAATLSAAHAQTVQPWDDPVGRTAIDEWLSRARLTRWGQWEGRTRSATIIAYSTVTTDEELRHKLVYRAAQNNRANTNITLREFVAARLAGEFPNMIYTPPPGHVPR